MSSKPQIKKLESTAILNVNKVTDKVAIIGIRGYYLDSYGKKGENDRAVYDDVIIVISPRCYATFRANTDPSIYRAGVATMKTGVHRYYKGKHKGLYWALRLVGEKVAVTRDGERGDKIGIALNIHKGGNRTTGSLGCQTLMPADWDEFIELVYDEMDAYGQKEIPYVLIEEKLRRAGIFQMARPALTAKDIDDLVDRLGKNEPAAKVGNSTVLPKIPSPNPASSKSDQPQILDVSPKSPMQPVQTILTNAVEVATGNLAVPSLGEYVGKSQEVLNKAQEAKAGVEAAMNAVDRLKEIKDALGSGNDSKKSLWSTIIHALYQTIWAVAAFFLGIPKEVWIIVAVIVAVIGFFYLYRQISLGKIRETARMKLLDIAESLK